ncbi:hypothetical protein E1B28_012869 [Marasmius oreades]|uniref:Uncharacterized protein n=1 Tax=Marasmius oreades TaxID=181124 RepID=A0A9P7UPE7_9AGAR|nr:uncharacterized protein E1B28_012869 [Marasmius oreades]KAG7088925.1 hypothetical protein E1B28_012869 [Marasmius oreades]
MPQQREPIVDAKVKFDLSLEHENGNVYTMDDDCTWVAKLTLEIANENKQRKAAEGVEVTVGDKKGSLETLDDLKEK